MLAGCQRRCAEKLSVCPGEDGGTAWPPREEILPLLPLEGQEPDRGPGVFLDLLLRLRHTVPGGDNKTALSGDDLPELLVAFGPTGVRIAELRGLKQHIILDLAYHSLQPVGQLLPAHEHLLPCIAPNEDGLPLLDILGPEF